MSAKKPNLHQLRLHKTREDQKSQGYFDGRFLQRSIPSGKIYRRKSKHKNDQND